MLTIVKKYCRLISIIGIILLASWCAVRIVNSVVFTTECEQFLKRAADANTIELAREELGKAVIYLEKNGLTEGCVSIILNQPKNDVGYWYKNLKTAHEELMNVSEETSSLERTNLLMKLRETLTDTDDKGETVVTVPDGISIYPHNGLFFMWSVLAGILCIPAILYLLVRIYG